MIQQQVSKGPVTVAVVGAGHRGVGYAHYAVHCPERMKVVAVADPHEARRVALAQKHGVPPERQYPSYQALIAAGLRADAVINGTMDQMHYASTKALLEAGYHVLLEKPIAPTAGEVRELIKLAQAKQRVVMICHVLRYAPFYQRIKQLIDEGTIGRLIALRSAELVSYHHMAVGFVRGRWNQAATSNPMLLAKCCHDLDLIAWFMSGQDVAQVASFGSLTQFRRENAPAGATARCLECPHVDTCRYSAKKHYVDMKLWGPYAFETHHVDYRGLTEEQRLASLRDPANPYGRCVWHCDNDVVDHQNVIVRFANGVTATHDMWGATARPTRTLHLLGELGEIEGDLDAGWIRLRQPQLEPGEAFVEKLIDLGVTDSSIMGGHGGGDGRLVADFVSLLRGESTSPSQTRIEDSLTGHLIAFAADEAMRSDRVVRPDEV